MDMPDEMMRFSIHFHEFSLLNAKLQKAFKEYEDIEFYPNGTKNGKPLDKVKEFKRVLKEFVKQVEKCKGEEDNIQCIMIDQMLELMRRMMLKDFKKLKLEKILED
jgi:hypothetical protein